MSKAATKQQDTQDAGEVITLTAQPREILVVRVPHVSEAQAAKVLAEMKTKLPENLVIVIDSEWSLEKVAAVMPRLAWEHLVIDLDDCTFAERHEQLNAAGENGFELVTIESGLAYLKRPVVSAVPEEQL